MIEASPCFRRAFLSLLIVLAPVAAAISAALIHLLMFRLPVGFDDVLHPINATIGAVIAAVVGSRLLWQARGGVTFGVLCFLLAYPVYLFAFGEMNLALLHVEATLSGPA